MYWSRSTATSLVVAFPCVRACQAREGLGDGVSASTPYDSSMSSLSSARACTCMPAVRRSARRSRCRASRSPSTRASSSSRRSSPSGSSIEGPSVCRAGFDIAALRRLAVRAVCGAPSSRGRGGVLAVPLSEASEAHPGFVPARSLLLWNRFGLFSAHFVFPRCGPASWRVQSPAHGFVPGRRGDLQAPVWCFRVCPDRPSSSKMVCPSRVPLGGWIGGWTVRMKRVSAEKRL